MRKLVGETSVRTPRSSDPQPLSAAAALVRRHDRDRFQTALFAPAARREALFALYAFNYEIARVRESVSQPILGRIRLEWWRENVAAAFAGGSVRRYEIVAALTAAIRERALTRAHFDRLIDARESDFDEAPPASLAALEDYAEATSARLVMLALEILDVRTRPAAEAAHHVGIAYALAGLLRAMPLRAGAGRPIIPADIATRTGLDSGDWQAQRATPALRAAIAEVAAAASSHLSAARARPGGVPRAALPALLPAVVATGWLRRLQRARYDPFDPAATRPDPLQGWRLAAAALRNRF